MADRRNTGYNILGVIAGGALFFNCTGSTIEQADQIETIQGRNPSKVERVIDLLQEQPGMIKRVLRPENPQTPTRLDDARQNTFDSEFLALTGLVLAATSLVSLRK